MLRGRNLCYVDFIIALLFGCVLSLLPVNGLGKCRSNRISLTRGFKRIFYILHILLFAFLVFFSIFHTW